MPDLKLYNYYRSSTSYRVRIALELKNLKYTYIPIHLLNNNGEQNGASYRELNPMGGVPTLVHNGRALAQSLPIIEYIDEVFNTTNPLFSKDVYLKSKIKQACEIINADTHPLQNLKVTQYLENELKVNELQKNLWLQKWIKEGLMAFEKTITQYSGVYCFGETVSAADLFLVPQLVTAKRFGIDFSEFKILNKINNHCLELPAFNIAHPFKQIDTPDELRIS